MHRPSSHARLKINLFEICRSWVLRILKDVKINFCYLIIGKHFFQTLNPDVSKGHTPFDTDILDNVFGSVWPDFGGGGSPKRLAPRSG